MIVGIRSWIEGSNRENLVAWHWTDNYTISRSKCAKIVLSLRKCCTIYRLDNMHTIQGSNRGRLAEGMCRFSKAQYLAKSRFQKGIFDVDWDGSGWFCNKISLLYFIISIFRKSWKNFSKMCHFSQFFAFVKLENTIFGSVDVENVSLF